MTNYLRELEEADCILVFGSNTTVAHLVPKNEFPIEVLLNSILEAERNLFSCREVQVTDMNSRTKKGELGICPVCREAYSKKQDEMCLSCQGSTYGDD